MLELLMSMGMKPNNGSQITWTTPGTYPSSNVGDVK